MKISFKTILSTIFAIVIGIEGQYIARPYRYNYSNGKRSQYENSDESIQQSTSELEIEPRYSPYFYGLSGALLGAAAAGTVKKKKDKGTEVGSTPFIIPDEKEIPICIVTKSHKKKKRRKKKHRHARSLIEGKQFKGQLIPVIAGQIVAVQENKPENNYSIDKDFLLPSEPADSEEQEQPIQRPIKIKRNKGHPIRPQNYYVENDSYTDDDYFNNQNRRHKLKRKEKEEEISEVGTLTKQDSETIADTGSMEADEYDNDDIDDDEEDDDDEYLADEHQEGHHHKNKHETIHCILIKHKYSYHGDGDKLSIIKGEGEHGHVHGHEHHGLGGHTQYIEIGGDQHNHNKNGIHYIEIDKNQNYQHYNGGNSPIQYIEIKH